MNGRVLIVLADILTILLLVFFLLPHEPEQESEDDGKKVARLGVEIHWPDDYFSDVDLWVKAPGDGPVGYSRSAGDHFSLVRDDRGMSTIVPRRYEHAVSRTVPDGEYIVNVHLFGDRGQNAPVTVDVVIWLRDEDVFARVAILWSGSVTLEYIGHEVTAVRFRIQDGEILPGSIHHTFKKLRSGQGSDYGAL